MLLLVGVVACGVKTKKVFSEQLPTDFSFFFIEMIAKIQISQERDSIRPNLVGIIVVSMILQVQHVERC